MTPGWKGEVWLWLFFLLLAARFQLPWPCEIKVGRTFPHLTVSSFAGFWPRYFSNLVPASSAGYFLLGVAVVRGVILFFWLPAASSEFARADCSVRTQLGTGTCVGGSVTCSSQRREKAINVERRQCVFPTVCFAYIFIFIAYIVQYTYVWVCVLERGLGARRCEARETGLNSILLAPPQLSSDRNVRM